MSESNGHIFRKEFEERFLGLAERLKTIETLMQIQRENLRDTDTRVAKNVDRVSSIDTIQQLLVQNVQDISTNLRVSITELTANFTKTTADALERANRKATNDKWTIGILITAVTLGFEGLRLLLGK